MNLDELIAEQSPNVQSAIEELIEAAGTADADSSILIEAGKRVATLNKQCRDLIARVEELEASIRNVLGILSRCHTSVMAIGGQTTEAMMARAVYVQVPITVGIMLQAIIRTVK